MSRCLRVLLILLLAGAAAAQTAAPATDQFRLQSNFWVNLHDLLYQHALSPQCPQGQINGECAHYYDIAPADQDAWNLAVRWYAANFVKRSLVFDEGMVRISNLLAALPPDANLDHRDLPEGMVDALRTAAPVYRKYWWPDQDYFNQRWIEAVTPRLRKSGAELAQQLARVYGAPWPATPIVADLVAYAGPAGAYGTLDPPHIVISSTDRRNQGGNGIDILFREASRALTRNVWNTLAADFRARQRPLPQDLWEALLGYTSGALVSGVVPGYTTPSEGRLHDLLERDWKPYLEGQSSRESALAKLAADY